MRPIITLFFILALLTIACGGTATALPSSPQPDPVKGPSSTPTAASVPQNESTVTPQPANLIKVDTLEQEVYPFTENGKCSLSEAIIAANSGKAVDTCAAGVPDESVIELMPGTYSLTQMDETPQQGEWAYSTTTVGNGLPAVIRSLTIHGNGAVIQRDGSAEPFRLFEVLYGTLAIDNLTLQGGDAGEDWGGGVLVSNASLVLNDVKVINNRARNGGGVYLNLGALTVSNCAFENNQAGFAGAGLFLESAKASFKSVRFIDNYAEGIGGGLKAEAVTLVVEDSLFVGNRVDGTRGGAIYARNVNMQVAHSQFYQNQADFYGGAISVNNPTIEGTDSDDGDPIDQLDQSPVFSDLLTLVPGFQSTLEAHPSGIFEDFHEDSQIHDSCFANNITLNPEDPNWAAALVGKSMADSNYWGDPSGPAGMGPGRGDLVGKRIDFEPFLSQMPEYCDPSMATQK